MEDSIQAPEDASAEMQEIIKELGAEGKGTPAGQEPKPEVEKGEPKTEEKPEEVVPEIEDENKNKQKPPDRQAKFVPVSKYNEERHKRQEIEARAAKAEQDAADLRAKFEANADKPKQEDITARAKRLADKHNLEEDFIKDLLEEATPKHNLPPELADDIKTIKEQRAQLEAQTLAATQETAFTNEFNALLKEFPDLADRKEDLKQLAFSEGNVNTSLRRIAIEYQHDNPSKPGKRSAESPSKSGGSRTEVIDFESMTEDQVDKLSGEDFDKFIEWRTKKK